MRPTSDSVFFPVGNAATDACVAATDACVAATDAFADPPDACPTSTEDDILVVSEATAGAEANCDRAAAAEAIINGFWPYQRLVAMDTFDTIVSFVRAALDASIKMSPDS